LSKYHLAFYSDVPGLHGLVGPRANTPKTSPDSSGSIEQHSEGANSPNIVGSNNQVIISAPPSRVLTPDNGEKYSAEIAKGHGQINAILASQADDVFPLSQQICDSAMKVGRWGVCPMGRNAVVGRDVVAKGIECYAANWDESSAAAFKKAMGAVGLSCTYISQSYNFGGEAMGGVTVRIGSP
jgi:hypothetical protein